MVKVLRNLQVAPLLKYMNERHLIHLRRKAGQIKPWTKDPILQKYRFCQVYRELDTVTIWIREHLREPAEQARIPYAWFLLCMARQINWPETLQEILDEEGLALSVGQYNAKRVRDVMMTRRARGEKVYTGAYMVYAQNNANAKPGWTCEHVLASVWKARERIDTWFTKGGMQSAWSALTPHPGWGGFMAYEVVCDARYMKQYGGHWDPNEWAHAGPGAIRGLNRLLSREVKSKLSQADAVPLMQQLLRSIEPDWGFTPKLELREIEHSLCEMDKYLRVKNGEGRPRSLYPGAAA
jgi:alpha-glutamyl/putrescinyl thymine pyrophosphorylase clade 1